MNSRLPLSARAKWMVLSLYVAGCGSGGMSTTSVDSGATDGAPALSDGGVADASPRDQGGVADSSPRDQGGVQRADMAAPSVADLGKHHDASVANPDLSSGPARDLALGAAPDLAPGGADLGLPPAAIEVDVTSTLGAIHPEIYGLAFADGKTLSALRAPLDRWGGNGATLYNWQLDVSNHANDYYYENIPNNEGDPTYGSAAYVSAADQFVVANQGAGAATLMTIPTIGWTPKDRIEQHPYTCGFPVKKYGAQQSVDPYDTNCGNGNSQGGAPITGDPANDAVAATPAFEGQWLSHLVGRFGEAGAGGVAYYQLDNEMALWDSTHRDVRATPVASDDVWQATLDYAPIIKAADPGAFVLGYGSWGVLDLFLSGLDSANNSTADQKAHGGIPLARWYLRQLATDDAAYHRRLVDCLDLHYYPMGGDPLESTRSLWDATYHDPSWVDQFLGEPVQLLPRVQGWIADEYAGTGVCISEYNFNLGDETNPQAALSEAEVLGIFGKYGVRLAAYWTTPVDDQGQPLPPYYAFQMFRNYDGAGGAFGDQAVETSTALDKISVYAATDSASTMLTVVLINKGASDLDTTLGFPGYSAGATAQAYVYQAAQSSAGLTKSASISVAADQVPLHLPALSMSLLAIPGK